MNLKLLDPREVVAGAERAWREGRVPLAAAEGFIRQVLGWREYVRGIYWHFMPEYATATRSAPTGRCRSSTGPATPRWTASATRSARRCDYGYAHHIQRLMVTGLFALLVGVEPRRVHEWYLAVYVDAVEWVELPNTLGMSQYADGGVMASKPYCATGKYLQRMSNACKGCRYDPAKRHRPRRLPVHDALLGLPCAARGAARRQSADDDAAQEPVAQGGRRRAGDPPPGGRPAGAVVVACRGRLSPVPPNLSSGRIRDRWPPACLAITPAPGRTPAGRP